MKQEKQEESQYYHGKTSLLVRVEPNTGSVTMQSSADGDTYRDIKTFSSFEEVWYDIKDVHVKFLIVGNAKVFTA